MNLFNEIKVEDEVKSRLQTQQYDFMYNNKKSEEKNLIRIRNVEKRVNGIT